MCATLVERDIPAASSRQRHRSRNHSPTWSHWVTPLFIQGLACGRGKRSADPGAPFHKMPRPPTPVQSPFHRTLESRGHLAPPLLATARPACRLPSLTFPAPGRGAETQKRSEGAGAGPAAVPRSASAGPEPRGATPSPSDDALPALPALAGRALALAFGSCSAPGASGGGGSG